MKAHVFKLTCLTDLHVGNGEANYSIIDNEVQKDSVLKDVPCIPGSGVKGALKDFFEEIWKDDNYVKDRITKVFGGVEEFIDETGKKKTRTVEGAYKFMAALCLARPLRVTDGPRPYVLATSNAILNHFSTFFKGLGCADLGAKLAVLRDGTNIEYESVTGRTKHFAELNGLIDRDFLVIDNLQEYSLPVRARNVLDENGQSKNIWYEEYVPHTSIFCFAILTPNEDCDLSFEPNIPVQFGGNSSIGNGYCKIEEVRYE